MKAFFQKNFLFLLSSLVFLNWQCNIINKDEAIPSYIYINKFSLTDDLLTQGYPSEKITDAWVYANDQQIGVFELPATIPVLFSGETKIDIFPGIKENGISGTGIIYPFYKAYSTNANLQPAITDTLSPSTTYNTAVTDFILTERFESGDAFSATSLSDTSDTIITDTSLVFEGSRCDAIFLDSMRPYGAVQSYDLTFPPIGKSVFLELDYKTNIEFEVRLNGNALAGFLNAYVITITPKDYWNKIYINLTSYADQLDAITYNIELRATKPDNVEKAEIYFDNVKIVASK